MTDELSAEEFEALAGKTLSLTQGDQGLAVNIREVRRLKSPSPRKTPPFAVVFRADGDKRSAAQGIYRLEMAERGATDIFIVPIGPDDAGHVLRGRVQLIDAIGSRPRN